MVSLSVITLSGELDINLIPARSPRMDPSTNAALKCLRSGMEALGSGDRDRAFKLFRQARRLDPSLPLDDLLSSAAGRGSNNTSPTADGATDFMVTDQGSVPSSSSTNNSRQKTRLGEGPSRSYTEEQFLMIGKISSQKNYYEILGLEHNCTVKDVHRAYRKLSLKVHPDKNNAPGAEKAFKAVSEAFQCLNDVESRKRYDLCGLDERSLSKASAMHYDHVPNGFDDEDFDADSDDDLFRSFLYDEMPLGADSFEPNVHRMHGNGNFSMLPLIQMLPIFILLLLYFMPSPRPVSMLARSDPYEFEVVTPRSMLYFVESEKLEGRYPFKRSERMALEKHIEDISEN